MKIEHPQDDPLLVSYHRPELRQALDDLELTLDCWNLLSTSGRGKEKSKYLPKDPGEYPDEYEPRLKRATYTPIFRDAIRGYAGLLGRFQLIFPPPSLTQAEFDVDRQGSSISSFWNHCDELALRDGGTYVVVDMLPSAGASNYRDESSDGRLPYLIQVQRRDLINWSTSFVNGEEVVDFAVLRQIKAKKAKSGFGVVLEPVYYHMTPGLTIEYRLEFSDGKWRNKKGQSVATSMTEVPIVWYGSSTTRFGQGGIPMAGLAELSVQHFQMRSDLVELLHKCAMPVPVRKGAPVNASTGKANRLMLGSNTGVDLPETGDFKFAEPTGNSLQRHQEEISHLEDLMDRSSLNFLYGTNSKTATEASLRASQISSQVSSLTRNKAASFRRVMILWAKYSGEMASIVQESGIAINESLISRPIDPSGMAQLLNLHKARVLSKRTVLDELVRGGVLDPDLKVEDEISRVNKEGPETEPEPPARAAIAEEPDGGQTGEEVRK
jgi:hypothetical protein